MDNQKVREGINRSKRSLAKRIAQVAEPAPAKLLNSRDRGVLRIQVKTARTDSLSWLDAQKARVKVYWADRKKQFEMAGIGQADAICSDQHLSYSDLFSRINNSLSGADSDVRFYGGVRFSNHRLPDPGWRIFGACRFILPRFELYNHNEESSLVCNLVYHRDRQIPLTEILCELEGVTFPQENEERKIPMMTGRRDDPDEAGWRQNVESAIRLLDQGGLQKIVLARKSSFDFTNNLDPIALLQKLRSAVPECFHFCFIPEPGVAFIGASPERLYLRQGKLIQSEAIAGTRPRGTSAASDEELGQNLLHSDKDLREHRFVVQGIRETLSPLCQALEVGGEISIMRLAQCQHLVSFFKGTLANGVLDADILQRLQPTPAVGGYPVGSALDEIDRLESFDRGWYAGPIGWVSPDATEFAVAIRSGLIDGSKLSLFSGAGIVEGSTADGEWDEIENKISYFIKVLDNQ
ncbi:MAG: isochorismate synthase MenF [Candidatus Binatia bacterium]